jgi:hypothetical protein
MFALVHALKERESVLVDKSREGLCLQSRVIITNFELASQHVGFFGMCDDTGQLVGTRNEV